MRRRTKRLLQMIALFLTCSCLMACSKALRGTVAPIWVYRDSNQNLLELYNPDHFCLYKENETVCGTYAPNAPVFATAMKRMGRKQDQVPGVESAAKVILKSDNGNEWTWTMQPDGVFNDQNGAAWTFIEFRQLWRTHKAPAS